AGIDLWACLSRDDLAGAAREAGVHVADDDTWEDLFFKVSLEWVEPRLGQRGPTLVFDYPAPLALLAKLKAGAPDVAERFEVFAGGMELANGFTELNDPQEQRARWERELEARRRKNPGDSPPLDEAFLQALEAGVPPAAGVALGLDRLVMLLADRADIGEVRCFALEPEG
ncbi:MAG: amino acid--tRNA ligase-related protein, partial [Nitrospinota bacterium]